MSRLRALGAAAVAALAFAGSVDRGSWSDRPAMYAQQRPECATWDITRGPRPVVCDTGDDRRSPGDLGPNGDGWQTA